MRSSCVSAFLFTAALFLLSACAEAQADRQNSEPAAATATVPRLIRVHGMVRADTGKPFSGSIGITFTLYQDATSTEVVWQEVQSVQLDSTGHFNALLGASSEGGVPLELFSSGEARWLGIRPDGQAEQPRILFLSVPYALKAADTEMLGGKPASAFALAGSAFALAQPVFGTPMGSANSFSAGKQILGASPQTACPSITSDGTATVNQLAKFTDVCNIQNSAIFESGGNVGIGNSSPAGALDVSGKSFLRGLLSLPATGTATASQGFTSNPFDLQASSFSSSTSAAVAEDFRWQTEPTGNNSSNPSGTLNLLFGSNGNSPSETGFSIASNGRLNFASGQTFPGTGSGTVTSVGTGAGLTGGPITSTGTISIPSAGVTNGMLANNSVTITAGAGLSGGGTVALGGTISLTNSAPSSGGTVTSVGSGTGLTGGPITSSGTLSLNTSFTDGRYLQLSGGALTGGLAGTTASFTGPLAATTATFSGAVTEGGAIVTPSGTANATQGFISYPLDIEASVYNSNLSKAASYIFQWQAEPTGNNSSNSGATLNLLYGVSGAISETGLSVNRSGILTFASGQTFPGGSGTVTSVGTGAGLTGGPITTSGTISIPNQGVTNSMLANPSITVVAGSGLSGGGTVALGGSVTLTNTASGGTVTSVGTGAGLTGGPVTTTGTISIPAAGVTNSMLANPSITVAAGSGLSGGGTVALGGTVTLSSNLSGTPEGIAYFSSATNLTSTAAPTNGQILIGSTGKAPVLTTLTAGSNVSITNGAGSVTISATGGSAQILPFFATGSQHTGASQAATTNVTKLWGFLLPYGVITTKVTYDVTTADNSANKYDVGIFDNSGNLMANIGSTAGTTFAPAKAFKTLAWKQGSISLSAGRYYLAFTTNCSSTCAKLGANNAYVSFAINASAGTSSGGALPSTVTPPADTWNTGGQPTLVLE
jgi:trimeric autotransporter adhesin